MIQLKNVHKHYQTAHGEVRALDGVSLEVNEGEFVAVQGHSGSGKSTLLAMVGGLALPTRGQVIVADHEVSAMSPSERAKFRADSVGFVFQMFHLLPYLNIVDNVLVAAPSSSRQDARERALELLGQFGLDQRRTHQPSQLSAGERQRVAMARALLNRPRLLLADEPTGNLDPKNAEGLLSLLGDFHKSGGTILLVTHDVDAASRAERRIAMETGKLVDSAVESKPVR